MWWIYEQHRRSRPHCCMKYGEYMMKRLFSPYAFFLHQSLQWILIHSRDSEVSCLLTKTRRRNLWIPTWFSNLQGKQWVCPGLFFFTAAEFSWYRVILRLEKQLDLARLQNVCLHFPRATSPRCRNRRGTDSAAFSFTLQLLCFRRIATQCKTCSRISSTSRFANSAEIKCYRRQMLLQLSFCFRWPGGLWAVKWSDGSIKLHSLP